MSLPLTRRSTLIIVIAIGALALIALSYLRPWTSESVTAETVSTNTEQVAAVVPETAAFSVAILPPLDDALLPFPDEDEAAFDAVVDAA